MREKLARIQNLNTDADTGGGDSLPVADSIALLKRNFRFDATGKIGALSSLINRGLHDQAIELLISPEASVNWIVADTEKLAANSLDSILPAYRDVIRSNSISAALDAFNRARILCAVNHGPFGVIEINRFIEKKLPINNLADKDGNYMGRPLLIGRNDYDLELFNGDTGIVWPDENNQLRAWFRTADGALRHISLHRLPQHSTSWAMTVHKSQGSEFEQVVIILPEEKSSLLARELLYTGVTRARSKVTVFASENALSAAISRITSRNSGLAKKLGWPDFTAPTRAQPGSS
jgi:exodeoxyribonuclease V alpha subunit